MSKYWIATIKHFVQTDEGKIKKTNSVYLVDAVNHTEVEVRLTERMAEIIKGDFEIKPIRDSGISEIVNSIDKDFFFNIRYEYEADKKVTDLFLVAANSCKEAIELFNLEQTEFMLDYDILSVSKTKILDVFLWEPKGFEEKWTLEDQDGEIVVSGSISVSNTDDEQVEWVDEDDEFDSEAP